MINLALYSHVIDFAGTWRAHERIAEVLQFNKNFNISILYSPVINHNRLDEAKKALHRCNFVQFDRSLQKSDASKGWCPITSNIDSVVRENNIHILHFARSGYYEWPFTERIAPVQIETNIFGYRDSSQFLDGTIYIGKCLGINESSTSKLIPNPTPRPTSAYDRIEDLRGELNIKKDELVFGRIGRPANFSPIALTAFNEFRKHVPSKYIIVGACNETQDLVRNYDMQDHVIMIECTNDDHFIERFHKTIDVFAHYRSDGEICSTAITQALMYGIPVITHNAGLNGQAEWLGPGGVCVNNHDMYLQAMLQLSDPTIRKIVGLNAKEYAMKTFEQESVVKKIANFYTKIYSNCQQEK